MSISFQTNIASMTAATNLNNINNFQTKTITQLTSGYRINSSGDDAAGLAVANGYANNIAGLTQGVMNANDGVSTLQIIDGGLSNISTMLNRMQTLATESASSTFTGNRATLDTEYQTLVGEINREASNVGLSSTNSLNATNLSVYIGGGQSATTGSQVTINLSQGKVDSGALGLAGTNVAASSPVTFGNAVNGVIGAGATESFTVNTASGSSTFSIVGQTGDTATTQLSELNSDLGAYGISASLDTSGKLAFSSAGAYSVSVAGAGLANNGDKGINTDLNNQQVTYVTGSGANTFTVTEGSTHVNVSIADSLTDTAAVASLNSQLQAGGITDITGVLDQTAAHKISLQSASTFSLSTLVNATTTGYVAATGTGNGALNAINAVTNAVQALGSVQGRVGAGENDLGYAINLANSQITNFSSAESGIRDADVATEAANLTKAQVLEQASVAAMAQANSAPQAVLALLKG
jgi:flagellin